MGFFSSIGKFFKGILNGVKSVFKWVGKILNSKIGRVLLIAAAVFTAGTALVAGVAAGSAAAETGAGFLNSFVAGGHAFVAALAHPLATFGSDISNGVLSTGRALADGAGADVGAIAGSDNAIAASTTDAPASLVGDNAAQTSAANLENAQAATGAGAGTTDVSSSPISTLTNPTANPTVGVPPSAATPAGAQSAVTPMSGSYPFSGNNGVVAAAPATPSGGAGGLLSKAFEMAGKIPAPVAVIAGNAASGYAQGKAQEAIADREWQHQQYTNNLWDQGGGQAVITAAGQPIKVNPGYLAHAQSIADFMNGRTLGAPNVTVGMPQQATGTTVGA